MAVQAKRECPTVLTRSVRKCTAVLATGRHVMLSLSACTQCLFVALITCTAFALGVQLAGVSLLSCFLPSVWKTQNACSARQLHPWQGRPSDARAVPAIEIAVAVVVDDFLPAGIRQLTVMNKALFAQRWGHVLVAPSVSDIATFAGKYPTPWAKFPVIMNAFEKCRFVFMIDADAVFMRGDIDLRIAAGEMDRQDKDILISKDFNSLNSGVFMMRRSVRSLAFLKEAMLSRQLLGMRKAAIPLQYENRAFFYHTGEWPSCAGLPRIDTWLAPRYFFAAEYNTSYFAAGLLVVDRCLINQHYYKSSGNSLLDLHDSGASYDNHTFAFIVHCPGGSLASKIFALTDLLARSDLQ